MTQPEILTNVHGLQKDNKRLKERQKKGNKITKVCWDTVKVTDSTIHEITTGQK